MKWKKRLSLRSEKKQETKGIIDKVRSYDLKFDRGSIEYLRLGLSENGKYGYIVFLNKKDNKSYIQINNQTYGPYDDVSNFIFTKDNKAYIIYTKDNKMTIERID
jgi:hypothetical protein